MDFIKLKAVLFFVFYLTSTSLLSQEFVSRWTTDNTGTSNNDEITIPATGTNYDIAWEEVGTPANNGTETGTGTHTVNFPSAGTYQVSLSAGAGTLQM